MSVCFLLSVYNFIERVCGFFFFPLFFFISFFFFLSLKLPNLTVKLSLIFWTQVMWRVAESSHTNHHTGWGRVKGALDVCVPCYLLKEK